MYLLRGFKEICPTDNILFLVKLKFCVYIVMFKPCLSSMCFPGGSLVDNLPASAGNASSISGWGRSPGGGNGNPLRYSCLEHPMDTGAWRASSPWGQKRVRHDLVTEQHQCLHVMCCSFRVQENYDLQIQATVSWLVSELVLLLVSFTLMNSESVIQKRLSRGGSAQAKDV